MMDSKEAMEMLKMVFPEKMVLKLIEVGFLEAPASRKFHGNYKGGLLEHSMEVAKCLADMTEKMGLLWERKESPYVVGLLHDLCKVEDYTWKETQDGFEIEANKKKLMEGHGSL